MTTSNEFVKALNNVKLCVRPHEVMAWSEFSRNSPRFSCALDGYCSGPPRYDSASMVVNFNHHEGVDRLGTRSTAAQVWVATQMGFRNTFEDPRVFVNDCDEDVCLAIFILRHPQLIQHPRLIELVQASDLLDSTMGLWAGQALHTDNEIAWVYEPCRTFKNSSYRRSSTSVDDFENHVDVIISVNQRIIYYLDNVAGQNGLDVGYDILCKSESGIPVIRERGWSSRRQIFQDGYRLWVAMKSEPNEKGYRTYAILKASQFIQPDLSHVQLQLNEAESKAGSRSRWGGADMPGCIVMGSDRAAGSILAPETILAVIEDTLSNNAMRGV